MIQEYNIKQEGAAFASLFCLFQRFDRRNKKNEDFNDALVRVRLLCYPSAKSSMETKGSVSIQVCLGVVLLL